MSKAVNFLIYVLIMGFIVTFSYNHVMYFVTTGLYGDSRYERKICGILPIGLFHLKQWISVPFISMQII